MDRPQDFVRTLRVLSSALDPTSRSFTATRAGRNCHSRTRRQHHNIHVDFQGPSFWIKPVVIRPFDCQRRYFKQ
jgi:hypothetical protein